MTLGTAALRLDPSEGLRRDLRKERFAAAQVFLCLMSCSKENTRSDWLRHSVGALGEAQGRNGDYKLFSRLL